MAGIKLCRIPKAKHPFYVSSCAVYLYTAEELCFFINRNPWLVDDQILSSSLTRWVAEELELGDVALAMDASIRREKKQSEILRPLFKEVGYLRTSEWKALESLLDEKEKQPVWVLKRRRGDALARNRRLRAATASYREALETLPSERSDSIAAFEAEVWYNLGVCAMWMLEGEEGIRSFRKAYSLQPERVYRMPLMLAMKLFYPAEKYRIEAEAFSPSDEEMNYVESACEAPVDSGDAGDDPHSEILRLAKDYHSETGT